MLPVKDMAVLKQYVDGIMTRASGALPMSGGGGGSINPPYSGHAQNVSGAVLTIAGAVVWRADSVEIRGIGKNQLWIFVNGKRYTFSYDHANGGNIMMKENSQQGKILHRFDNNTPATQIEAVFRSL